MTYPLVQFVAAPEVDAEVLFDFNDSYGMWDGAVTEVEADGWSIGTPQMQGDPTGAGIGWGERTLAFTMRTKGTRHAALRIQALLARQVLRPRNWLLFQLDPFTQPVWFATYNSQPGDLSFDQVYLERESDTWRIGVSLDAEPFAYGERIELPPVTISADPAAAVNPCFYRLPAIEGDAPAGLRIEANFSDTLNQSDIMWSLAPAAQTAPLVWQVGSGDGFTAGTDTGAPVASSAFSAGSYRAVTFATQAGLVTRLSGAAPFDVPPGRYKVMLRVARSDTDSTFSFRAGYHDPVFGDDMSGRPTVHMDRSASTTAGHATWLDLGVMSWPKFYSPTNLPGLDPRPTVALQVARLSGTGQAHLDALVMVPLEVKDQPEGAARTLVSAFPGWGPQAADNASWWDADEELYARQTFAGTLDHAIQPDRMQGGFLSALPGVPNVLHLFQQTRPNSGGFGVVDNSDSIARTALVTLSYHPRLLYLGEGADD